MRAAPRPRRRSPDKKALKQYAAWLATEDEIDTNPLEGLKRPAEHRKVTQALSETELKRLIDACKGKTFADRRDEALARLMAETGMRAGEVIALDVADIDLDRGCATVRRGKGNKGRVVPFGPQTVAALDPLPTRPPHATRDSRNTAALWLGAADKTFGYPGLDGALKARARAAGIEGFHAHRLKAYLRDPLEGGPRLRRRADGGRRLVVAGDD